MVLFRSPSMEFVRPSFARHHGQRHLELRSHTSRDYDFPVERLMIGEDNAKVFDALDVMDCVAAQIRTQEDCLITTTDDEDPECLSMDWVETEIQICLDSGCCEHVMDLGTP